MKRRRIAKIGLLVAVRYRHALLRLAKQSMRHPNRTTKVIRGARRAYTTTQKVQRNPRAHEHAEAAGRSALRAMAQTRKIGVTDAMTDRRVISDLRAAAEAMAGMVAATRRPEPRRGRAGRFVFGLGMIGAGAYAGYRVYRSASADHHMSADPSAFTSASASQPASQPQPSRGPSQ